MGLVSLGADGLVALWSVLAPWKMEAWRRPTVLLQALPITLVPAQLLSLFCRASVMGQPNSSALRHTDRETPLNGFGYTERRCLKQKKSPP